MTKGVEDGMGEEQTMSHHKFVASDRYPHRNCVFRDNGFICCGFWDSLRHQPAAVPEAKPEPPTTDPACAKWPNIPEFLPAYPGARNQHPDFTPPQPPATSLRQKIEANIKATGDWKGRTPEEVAAHHESIDSYIEVSPANPLSPQEERRSVEMFYEAELWIRHSSPILEGGQAWMDREQFSKALDEFINAVSIATPKVVDSKEEPDELCLCDDHGTELCTLHRTSCIECGQKLPTNLRGLKVEEQDGEQELPPLPEFQGATEDIFSALQRHRSFIVEERTRLLAAFTKNRTAKSVDSLSPSEGTESAKSAWNRLLYVLKLRWYQGDFTEADFHIPYAPPVAPPIEEK